jgi:Integrase core domain
MDFKGHFATSRQGPCHPLCVLDDHSRYALGVRACADQESATVKEQLTALFRSHGLPAGILADNGSAWSRQTRLAVWLMRLGLRVLHGRPHHPQTQGKLERVKRTLKAEAIGCLSFADLAACQQRFDLWRQEYNHRRPHEALNLSTPASRYRPSPQSFPEVLPAIEYAPADQVVIVNAAGMIRYARHGWMIGQAYAGLPVAVRPTLGDDAVKAVYFCQQKVAQINLREDNP